MTNEEVGILIITAFISLIILFLGLLYRSKTKSLDYEIERKTKLLEKCYGPLKKYFDMVGILDSPQIKIKAKSDVWEEISTIYSTYRFEIKSINEDLSDKIGIFITKKTRNRVGSAVYLEKIHSLSDNLDENDSTLRRKKKKAFVDWVDSIRQEIESIYKIYSETIIEYKNLRKSSLKILRIPFLKIR